MSSVNIKEHQSENSHVLMMRQMDPREVNSLVGAEPKFHVHYFSYCTVLPLVDEKSWPVLIGLDSVMKIYLKDWFYR